MRKYRLVAKKGEGTFSEVLKAQNVKDGKYHAIKCMKNRFESIDQVNNLREIQALRRLSPHDHIISLEEVLYDQPTGRLALVFELMDANLYELIKGRRHYLNPQLIKGYMWQLMKSLDHMHRKGIFHRDIKPENILIENTSDYGKGLKLADLGSCRGIYSKQPYTEYISTRWYRAPECLLTDGYYGPEMDLWGAGCVMFEITSLYPLFPGSNEVDQISRIHKVIGTPSPEIINKFRSKGSSHISLDFPEQKGMGIPQLIPHAGSDCIDLIVKLLKYDAADRITAREAMRHPYFKECRETDARRALLAQQQTSSTSAPTGAGDIGHTTGAESPAAKSVKSENLAPQGQIQKQGSDHNKSQQKGELPKQLPSIAIQSAPGQVSGGENISVTKFIAGSQAKPNVTVPIPGNNSGAVGAVLPPIVTGNSTNANNNPAVNPKYMFTDGNRNANSNVVASRAPVVQMTPVIPVQQKKKKKESARLRRGNGPNAEQVLRAYGVPSGGVMGGGSEELNISGGNSLYGSNNKGFSGSKR